MADPTRPFFALYVVWHPDFAGGEVIAEAVRRHFRRELYENVAGGAGLSVLYRFANAPNSGVPLPIDLVEAATTAVVVLVDPALATGPSWVGYVRDLVRRAEDAGLGTRVFPVCISAGVLHQLGVEEQALRWDRWGGGNEERRRRLIFELTYEFCRMLRRTLTALIHPGHTDEELEAYLRKVQIFLSHSKHDPNGERIAEGIRDGLHAGHGLASFFDVYDIPAGLRFHKVLLHQVKVSAMVAIHTDSYSSREWCRREVIEAKRWNVPLVVANSVHDVDERGFPYMGNVPVIRLDPDALDRSDVVIGRLLDEVLKDFLWRCRVELARSMADPAVVFMPRPPELISLASLPSSADLPCPVIVYPDPPLSAEEERLFAEIAPRVQLRSMTEWLAGAVR